LDDDLIFIHRSKIAVFWIQSMQWSSWCWSSVITTWLLEWEHGWHSTSAI